MLRLFVGSEKQMQGRHSPTLSRFHHYRLFIVDVYFQCDKVRQMKVENVCILMNFVNMTTNALLLQFVAIICFKKIVSAKVCTFATTVYLSHYGGQLRALLDCPRQAIGIAETIDCWLFLLNGRVANIAPLRLLSSSVEVKITALFLIEEVMWL